MVIQSTIYIAAPAERVWSLTQDIENWPAVTPTMTSVTRADNRPLAPGSTASVKQPRLPPSRWTVTELDPPRRFTWQTRRNGVLMTARHEIEPVADGCWNHLTIDVEGPRAGIVARLVGPMLRKAIATENDGFRRAAEGLDRPAYVDEHKVRVDAPAPTTWAAVEAFAERMCESEHPLLSRLLGTEPSAGFTITGRKAPRLVSLAGRHRFSTYVLDFRLVETSGGCDLTAVSYASFPGPHGLAYRTALMGSRGHVFAVRRMLRQIAAAADGDAS
ncbi:hypothetical protein ASG90_19105 [Nocardioides sp. Soil797]|nr:hypothetical protein ASG90_19105 [Nocardioides sp. Soil797]